MNSLIYANFIKIIEYSENRIKHMDKIQIQTQILDEQLDVQELATVFFILLSVRCSPSNSFINGSILVYLLSSLTL